MKTSNYLKEVREQYENYPYPLRDPEEEKTQLGYTLLDSLDQMNHYCFEGKQQFGEDFRALVAGGGTGDSAIYLAEQLRDRGGEVVYLDISQASMEVAKERAKTRGLDNIIWAHESLLELPGSDLGKFDYINCSGVLHHLADPKEGLQALKSVLKEDGAMGIMVYGQYGRLGVYNVQKMMRILNQNEPDIQKQIGNCKRLLTSLPPTNWFKMDEARISEHKESGDVGLYDLFLHSQDRAYTIPQLYEWVESCGLCINKMLAEISAADHIYLPKYYIKDKTLLNELEKQSEREQQAISEVLCGCFAKHSFYATTKKRPVPEACNDNYVPFFNITFSSNVYEQMYTNIKNAIETSQDNFITMTVRRGKDATQKVRFPYTKNMVKFFQYIDGKRTFKEIFESILADVEKAGENLTREDLEEEFLGLYQNVLANFEWMFLRHTSVPAFRAIDELQAPVIAKYAA